MLPHRSLGCLISTCIFLLQLSIPTSSLPSFPPLLCLLSVAGPGPSSVCARPGFNIHCSTSGRIAPFFFFFSLDLSLISFLSLMLY